MLLVLIAIKTYIRLVNATFTLIGEWKIVNITIYFNGCEL